MADRQDRQEEYDVIVVGTGAAGFSTALGALDEGLSVLMLESTARWGGNSSMSGGGMWLPDNPLMQADRVGDSREEALDYLEATVGDAGRATNRARKEAFVDGVADFVTTAQRAGMEFVRSPDYADYYPERAGGKIGRGIEHVPFARSRIGEWARTCQMETPMPILTDDVWLLSRAWSTVSGFRRGAEMVLRTAKNAVVQRGYAAGLGAGLTASFLDKVVLKGGVELRLECPLQDLVVEDGSVVGVVAGQDGSTVTLRARRGVMLAGGGFDHNRAKRADLQGIEGNPSGAPGNLGRPLEIAVDHGAATEFLEDAWWGASTAPTSVSGPMFILGERSLPHSIIIDEEGRRFANESESYIDIGHHMLAHDEELHGPGVHGDYWLVADHRHALKYLRNYMLDPKAVKAMKAEGIYHRADTLEELAAATGADPLVLQQTVERFNGFARAGVDGDYGRGNSAYDRYYSDPNVHPNPNLGTLEKGPFTAVKVVVGDLGTKGGVLCDEYSRALREDGSVIPGLYSAGNNSAAVMGHTYPGPGSTIGPAVVFGMIAARHMAGR